MSAIQHTITSTKLQSLAHSTSLQEIPFFSCRIAAGFASPADDHLDNPIDLNKLMVPKPAATFMLTVEGDSMIGAGIHDGDLLIIDRSKTATNGSVVIAVVHGELTVKRLQRDAAGIQLVPENPAFQPILISDESELVIWGCVTHAIHNL